MAIRLDSYVYDELKSNILYPEPPLTKDELDVLKKIAGKEKLFFTPMQLLAQKVSLKGKNIAISVFIAKLVHLLLS